MNHDAERRGDGQRNTDWQWSNVKSDEFRLEGARLKRGRLRGSRYADRASSSKLMFFEVALHQASVNSVPYTGTLRSPRETRHRADVIFMTMREDDGAHSCRVLLEIAEMSES